MGAKQLDFRKVGNLRSFPNYVPTVLMRFKEKMESACELRRAGAGDDAFREYKRAARIIESIDLDRAANINEKMGIGYEKLGRNFLASLYFKKAAVIRIAATAQRGDPAGEKQRISDLYLRASCNSIVASAQNRPGATIDGDRVHTIAMHAKDAFEESFKYSGDPGYTLKCIKNMMELSCAAPIRDAPWTLGDIRMAFEFLAMDENRAIRTLQRSQQLPEDSQNRV